MTRRKRGDFVFPAEETRKLILEVLPHEPSSYGERLELKFLYVPAVHSRALHPDNMLVVGSRGAGKSVWWAALQDAAYRRIVAKAAQSAQVDEDTLVSPGFGPTVLRPDDYPGAETLHLLLGKYEPRLVWRTIIAWHVTGKVSGPLQEAQSWDERIGWLKAHPEQIESALADADRRLVNLKQKHLIVFDALDKVSDQRDERRRLLRGLLQVMLDFRSSRSIRAKAFVRPDMLEDAGVSDFPDASKVLTSRVSLDWPKSDLYGLLWQHLGNGAEHGDMFRNACEEQFDLEWTSASGVWRMPEELRRDESTQWDVFHALTGPYMGSNSRRGYPYTWLPKHLADAHLKVSPRSFLFAMYTAAQSGASKDKKFALFHEALKQGVQEASRGRVTEISEDHAWIGMVMDPLKDLVIPCEFSELKQRWKSDKTIDKMMASSSGLPSRIDDGAAGLKQDLIDIGVLELMADGRINMPDVYRVGFGLRRKGGLPPIH
jgi:hypothetical protein